MPTINLSLKTEMLMDLKNASEKLNLSQSRIVQMSLEKFIPEIAEMTSCAEMIAEKRTMRELQDFR